MALYTNILVAYDGTRESDVALRQGADLAQEFKAKLYVLAIEGTAGGFLFDPAVVPAELLLVERNYLSAAMAAAVGNLGEQSAHVVTCIRDGEAAREIIAYAYEIKADLIVLGHSDKGRIAKWFEGATGNHVLNHAPCSVLIAMGEQLEPGTAQGSNSKTATDPAAPPCACSAAVLWLPEGEEPRDIEHFNAAVRIHQPERNREALWSLKQTVTHVQASNDQGKEPWVKVGNVLLSPADIRDLHAFYAHHGTRK